MVFPVIIRYAFSGLPVQHFTADEPRDPFYDKFVEDKSENIRLKQALHFKTHPRRLPAPSQYPPGLMWLFG